MRFIRGFALLPLLLCACGGGGGGGGGGGTGNAVDRQAGLEVLETCGLDTIDAFLGLLDLSVSIVDPGAAALPAIQVLDAQQTQGHIAWELNLVGDPAPEVIGFIQFTNNLGQPAEPPFDITQFVAAGLGSLDQFLDQLPNGWTVTVTANSPAIPPASTRFIFTYSSGAVSDTSGNADITSATVGCNTTFVLASAELADLAGLFPTAEFASTYNGATTRLQGTTTFDGTDVAIVDGEVNDGGAIYAYEADLGGGTVTALP